MVLLLFLTSLTAAQTPRTARDSVAGAMQSYVQAVRSSDAAAIIGWWADDAVYMATGTKTTVGRAALDSVVRGIFATMRVTEITEHTDEIVVDGNLALVRGVYMETLAPRAAGDAKTLRGRYLFVWRRQRGGGWKIARGVSTDMPGPTTGH